MSFFQVWGSAVRSIVSVVGACAVLVLMAAPVVADTGDGFIEGSAHD